MPRPSIAGLFDSTIRIWRPTTTRTGPGVEQKSYAVTTTVGAVINRSRTPTAPSDGGLAPSGIIRWYGLPTIDVQPRDVLEVMTGPDAGKKWECNELPTRPRGHHTQVDCVEYNGVLPDAEPTSDA